MMVATSLSAVILSLLTTIGLNSSFAWQPDYRSAVQKATDEKKPLAVFIGHGKSGHKELVKDGGLGNSETKTLSEAYVSLYVDADSESGKKLAQSFEISEGIIISDRTGSLQAVVHEGTVTKTELNDYLTRYAEPNKAVTTTELGGRRRPIAQFIQNRPIVSAIQTSYFSGST